MGGAGQLLNDELSGLLGGQSEDRRDLLKGDLAGGILEMGCVGPVTPPGDLDLVLCVSALFDVRGMPLLPTHVAKTALVTDQLKPSSPHTTRLCSPRSNGSDLPQDLLSVPRSPK